MQTALRLQTTVLPGQRIEVSAPELLEGDTVELIILSANTTSAGRYPAALEAAYDTLIQKKLAGTLTSEETLRLQAAREEISAIDQTYPDIRAQQAHKLSEELAQIRAELQALPPICQPTPPLP